MLKKIFLAAAIAIASPAFVCAQDIFWSLSPTSLETTTFTSADGATGSAYIFSDGLFGFDALDLDFSVSNTSVIRLTGGETFNSQFWTIGDSRFDAAEFSFDSDANTGNLFLVNVTQNGIIPPVSRLFDPDFVPGVGPNGANLLARVDFEILSDGASELEFNLGRQGCLKLPDIVLNPTFGPVTFNTQFSIQRVLGDVNFDGDVNFLDFSPFITVLSSYRYQYTADCNQDGIVDFLDVAPFIAIVSSQ